MALSRNPVGFTREASAASSRLGSCACSPGRVIQFLIGALNRCCCLARAVLYPHGYAQAMARLMLMLKRAATNTSVLGHQTALNCIRLYQTASDCIIRLHQTALNQCVCAGHGAIPLWHCLGMLCDLCLPKKVVDLGPSPGGVCIGGFRF